MNEKKLNLEENLQKITTEHREKFELFRLLLTEYNKKFNLTSITEEREILYKHFLDSTAGEFLFGENACICEVGSGAGFPSIPLKILREDLQITLIESTAKKCEFLELVCRKLNLKKIFIINRRAEEVAKSDKRESFDYAIARAVARENTLAEYCLPLVRINGYMIAYKGNAEEEVNEAKNAIRILGGSVEKRINYELPDGMGSRELVVVKKIKQTPSKYPRGQGKERSCPIV